jgi:hypothetical protein
MKGCPVGFIQQHDYHVISIVTSSYRMLRLSLSSVDGFPKIYELIYTV